MESRYAMNAFSMSTCWNVRKHSSGREMVEEIKELGFDKIELNYNVTKEMLQEIIPMINNGEISISSIHNVFPYNSNKAFDTDSLLLGYPDEKLRNEAIELTLNTAEFAHKLGARAIVIHPGEIPMTMNYNLMLENMIVSGRQETKEYKMLLNKMMEERESTSKYYVDMIRQSVEKICDNIMKKGYNVAVGLENRMMCHQIPTFQEMHMLLDALKDYPVYFWFDIGHGMLLQNIGMFNSLKESFKLKDKIIGMHIHDVRGIQDHLCPYLYSSNIDEYIELIRNVPIKVLELSQRNSADDVKKSAQMLVKRLNI